MKSSYQKCPELILIDIELSFYKQRIKTVFLKGWLTKVGQGSELSKSFDKTNKSLQKELTLCEYIKVLTMFKNI